MFKIKAMYFQKDLSLAFKTWTRVYINKQFNTDLGIKN